jgi:hypothetical protein
MLKINPSILADIILALQNFQKELAETLDKQGKNYFSEEKQKEVINRYFKNVSIDDLAIQFNCPKNIIEQVIFNKGIPLVDNKPPKIKWYLRKRKKSGG